VRNGRNRGKKPGFYDICLLVAFDGLKKPGFWGCLTSANKKPGFYFSVGWVAKVVARNPVSGVGWQRLSQETRFRRRRNRGKKPGFYDICLLVAFDGLKKPGFWGWGFWVV